jgi:CubicO group peptidase (beta-lactamase class C family)
MILTRATVGALALVFFGTHAAPAADSVATVNPVMESGGVAARFSNLRFAPSARPSPLFRPETPSKPQANVAEWANLLLTNNEGALTLLLLDRGKILFEGYKSPATDQTAQHSQSMSKSLTAYMVGILLCDGQIRSLGDRAEAYVPQLKGTVYGDATIKQLLTMSSGAAPATSSGNSYEGQQDEIRAGKVSSLDTMRRFGARDIAAGKEFRYLANDTQGSAFVIESLGGFANIFQKRVWDEIGAEAPGFWLIDKNNMPLGNAGTSVVARDWGRLALWSLKQLKSSNTCVRDFMKEATSAQIPNVSKVVGASFPSYGYQTWVRKDAYWWVGFGGQRVGIHPRTERILVLTSWREDFMGDVYKFFDDWIAAY